MHIYVYLFLYMRNNNKQVNRKSRGNEDLGRFEGGECGGGGNYVNTVLVVEILQKLIK